MEETDPSLTIEEDESKQMVMDFIKQTKNRKRDRIELRNNNIKAIKNRPEESFFKGLNCSLKKNSSFIKRLKNFSEAQKEALIIEMNKLNLTKYVSEAAVAIIEAKLKISDITSAVYICSLLHQRYSTFSYHVLEIFKKALSVAKKGIIENSSKLKIDLRYFIETLSAGVIAMKDGIPFLKTVLTDITTTDNEEHKNINIILYFCKHCGGDYAGLVPRTIKSAALKHSIDIPKSDLLTPDKLKNIRLILKDYYNSICEHVLKDYKALQLVEQNNIKIMKSRGILSNEKIENWKSMLGDFQKLLSGTEELAEFLNRNVPDVPQYFEFEFESSNFDMLYRFRMNEILPDTVWEDEESQDFHENLIDLKTRVPNLKIKEPKVANSSNCSKASSKSFHHEPKKQIFYGDDLSDIDKHFDAHEFEDIEDKNEEMDESDECSVTQASRSYYRSPIETFLQTLQTNVCKYTFDTATVEFCMKYNNKSCHKKLVKAFFLMPRIRLDLQPFYARFVATLYPCIPNIATELAHLLKQDLKYHVRKKSQMNLGSKIKVVRFIGELTKFQMFSKTDALFCLRILLVDFTHHHIEMVCNLLETCGMFLYRSPDSHLRTKIYLDQMMRKKSAKALDARYVTMIENAYFCCNPPESDESKVKILPPLFQYIQSLIYSDLSKHNTETTLWRIRKLDWKNPEIVDFCTETLSAIWNAKYYSIRVVTNLLAGISEYYQFVGSRVVDNVLEHIRFGIENNCFELNQKRIGIVKYLGEIYNYQLIEDEIIFQTLYQLIDFNVDTDGLYFPSDPPDHLFPLRLICVLLDTSGQYFNDKSSKIQLDQFIAIFQYYFLYKKTFYDLSEGYMFPKTIEYLVEDCLKTLRPELRLHKTLEEAAASIKIDCEIQNENILSTLEKHFNYGSFHNISVEGNNQVPQEEIKNVDDENKEENANCHISENDDDSDYILMNESKIHSEINIFDNTTPMTEDDEFILAFDEMMLESNQSRSQETFKPQTDIVIPLSVRGSKKATFDLGDSLENKSTTNFVLMTRKGNKSQFKTVELPCSSDIVQNLRDQEQVAKAEKEHVKKLTLDINERQQEEAYNSMLASLQRPLSFANSCKERKPKNPKNNSETDSLCSSKLSKF